MHGRSTPSGMPPPYFEACANTICASDELSTSWEIDAIEKARALRKGFEAMSSDVAQIHAAVLKHLAEGGELRLKGVVRAS